MLRDPLYRERATRRHSLCDRQSRRGRTLRWDYRPAMTLPNWITSFPFELTFQPVTWELHRQHSKLRQALRRHTRLALAEARLKMPCMLKSGVAGNTPCLSPKMVRVRCPQEN